MADNTVVGNGVKLVGELAILPGTSHLLEGDIKTGALYAVAAFAAKALIGGPAAFLVAADSFARSTSEKGLIGHIKDQF